jgi:hypothetical protein
VNNVSERTLRQVVVGRANWQFCGSAAGGDTAAALYSLVGTCKHLGIDPFAYLREALPALYALGDKPPQDALTEWLPDAWQERQRVSGPAAVSGEGPGAGRAPPPRGVSEDVGGTFCALVRPAAVNGAPQQKP